MNRAEVQSFSADFATEHDLTLLSHDLEEMFYLAMTSECLTEFDTADRVSFVKSYRSIKDLIISLQRQRGQMVILITHLFVIVF